MGGLCWLLLWVGINTGPENIDLEAIQGSWTGLFNGIRAAFPLIVLIAWFLHILLRKQHLIRSFTLPEALWLYYGIICLIASAYAEPWFEYAYWGFAYLSAFGAAEIYMRQSSTLERAGDLNRLTWVCSSIVLITVLWVARGQLVEQTSTGLSGYGVSSRMPTVGGVAMVRSSGISRLAAIPAIIVFVSFWNTQGVYRILSLAVFVPAVYLVWVMQSRGSLFSLAFALSFVMVFAEGKQRRVAIMIALIVVAVYVVGFVPESTVHRLLLYSTRGEQGQELASMSGRSLIFHESWQLIKAAPFIGYGPQADRRVLTIVGNAQNAVLYALLCGGFLGGTGFVGGLVVSWVFLVRALRRRHLMTRIERTTLLQVAGVLAFLTMRSYPENCAALFSVDLLIQLPAMVYLGELDRRMRATAATPRTVYLRQVQTAPALPEAVHLAN